MGRCCLCAMVAVFCMSLGLSGCGSESDPSNRGSSPADSVFQLIGDPDFDWYLSGDRRVAPLQIFSDNWRVWLQWHPGQPVPSVLVLEQAGWAVAQPRQHGKFSVLDGHWQQLRFQGGQLRADARHGREHRVSHDVALNPSLQSISTFASSPRHEVRMPPRGSHSSSRFEVVLEDQTVRQTLSRWAREHQWHFENSHWAVPVDLPVTASATFEGDFVTAVRALLSASDISGRPLQPCFYANRVLRVISANESCDPTARPVGAP